MINVNKLCSSNIDDSSTECIFLTRGELHIHGIDSISVHLRPNDPRVKDILRLMNLGKLQFITIDPKKINFYKSFFSGTWYLIPTLEYTGRADYSGYRHFSFLYKLDGNFLWDKKGIRPLSSDEIKKFKSSLSL